MTQKKDRRDVVIPLLLVALFLTHAAINYWVIWKDSTPFIHDMGTDYRSSVRLFYGLASHDYSEGLPPLDFFYVHKNSIPPLYFFMSLPFYALFGPSQDIAMLSNLFPLAILIFGTFKLGELLHSRLAGLLSAAFLSLFPFMFALSRTYNPKYAMVAFIPLSIYFLIKCERFTRLRESVLFGLMVAFSLLTYPNSVFFIIAPLCLAVGAAVVRLRKPDSLGCWALLRNLALSALPVFLFVGPWLIFNYQMYLRSRMFSVQITLATYHTSWLERTLSYHPLRILSTQLSLPALLVFLFALLVFVRKRTLERYAVLVWFLFPLLFFWLMVRNDAFTQLRYTVGYFPAIATITSLGLLECRPVVARLLKKYAQHIPYALVGMLLLVLVIQFVTISLMGEFCPSLACPRESDLTLPNYYGRFFPSQRDFDVVVIMDEIESRVSGSSPSVIFFSLDMENSNILMQEMALRNLNMQGNLYFNITTWNPVYVQMGVVRYGEPVLEEMLPLIEASDVIVYEDCDERFMDTPVAEIIKRDMLSTSYREWRLQDTTFFPLFIMQLDKKTEAGAMNEFAVYVRERDN